MSQIRTIVFDVGNVLGHFRWEEVCKDLGFDRQKIEYFRENLLHTDTWSDLDKGTVSQQEAVRIFSEKMPGQKTDIERFFGRCEDFIREYPYSLPLIKSLKQKGYGVYLLSNYPEEMFHLHWPRFSFFQEVDGYVVSALEKLLKPEPAIYRCLLDRYGLNPEECLFLDDLEPNVTGAIRVGMQSRRFLGEETVRDLCTFPSLLQEEGRE